MLDLGTQALYARSYGAVAINDPTVSVNELGDKIMALLPEDSTMEEINHIMVTIIKSGDPDRGWVLINYVLDKKPEWKQPLLLSKVTCLSRKSNYKEIIKITTEYEVEYGRDDDSLISLMNAYLLDGYAKHESEIKELTAQLQQKVEV